MTSTPWGESQTQETFGPGVVFHSTASHGGYQLSAERNAKVPLAWRAASFNKLGEAGWYEEDCDWCMVALTFPTLFSVANLLTAERTFRGWIAPKLPEGERSPLLGMMTAKPMNALNKWQRIAADIYAEGDFSHVTSQDEAKADNSGDTLFTFLMRELDDDCGSDETAIQRTERAIDDLLKVAGALINAAEDRAGS